MDGHTHSASLAARPDDVRRRAGARSNASTISVAACQPLADYMHGKQRRSPLIAAYTWDNRGYPRLCKGRAGRGDGAPEAAR